jgi:hypothetical protein
MSDLLTVTTGAEASGERSFGVRNKDECWNQGTESMMAANMVTVEFIKYADPSTAAALTACNADQKETGESSDRNHVFHSARWCSMIGAAERTAIRTNLNSRKTGLNRIQK